MESMKDVSKKYTLDYVLDEATRTRAEELYKDFYQRTIAKDASVSIVISGLWRDYVAEQAAYYPSTRFRSGCYYTAL